VSGWSPGMATPRQEAYLLRLAGVRFLSQVPGLSSADLRGGLLASRASEVIEELLAAQAAAREPERTDRLDKAPTVVHAVSVLSYAPVVASADLGPYLAGVEDALLWVLGVADADRIADAVRNLGVGDLGLLDGPFRGRPAQ
jgi:hypothetical protein